MKGKAMQTTILSPDSLEAEQQAVSMLDREISVSSHTRQKFPTVLEPPVAFGLSPEFQELDIIAAGLGIVWYLDNDIFTVRR